MNPQELKKYKRLWNIFIIVSCSLFIISIVIQWFSKWGFMNLPAMVFGGMSFVSIVARLLANKGIILGN